MKKKLFLSALFTAIIAAVSAQSNFGVDYFSIGEYQTAKTFFEKQLAQAPAQSNYYLGEIAFQEGKLDEAKAYFDKGAAADALYPMNFIGQGKLLLKSDPKAAEALFTTVSKKNKKNAEANVAIARAYYEAGMNDVTMLKLALAKKTGKKAPQVYTFEGDMLKAEGKLGEAGSKYEQALVFDPNYVVASIKCAQIYEGINPNLSIEIFNKVLAAHPDYTIANKGLGRAFNKNGQYINAIENFKKYVADGGQLNVDDYINYATSYYFKDMFEESMVEITNALKLDSSNFVLNRFHMWNAAKLQDINGLKFADYFFTLKSEKGFITDDYTAYAAILAQNAMYDEALKIYDKLMETESEKPEVHKELYGVYQKKGDYAKASETYKKFMDLTGKDYLTSLDHFTLGRAYFYAGQKLKSDSTVAGRAKRRDYILKADSVFAIVCALTPESYTGFMWRGNANLSLEKAQTEGLAKPYYEKAIEIILSKNAVNGNKKDLLLAYQYIATYYLQKDDQVNSEKYWKLIQELDPTNANAKMVLDEYEAARAKK